jgi:hypothetical protein
VLPITKEDYQKLHSENIDNCGYFKLCQEDYSVFHTDDEGGEQMSDEEYSNTFGKKAMAKAQKQSKKKLGKRGKK